MALEVSLAFILFTNIPNRIYELFLVQSICMKNDVGYKYVTEFLQKKIIAPQEWKHWNRKRFTIVCGLTFHISLFCIPFKEKWCFRNQYFLFIILIIQSCQSNHLEIIYSKADTWYFIKRLNTRFWLLFIVDADVSIPNRNTSINSPRQK